MSLQSDPNVTPMIDVLLVLLIVFMLTLPRVPALIAVQLPDESAHGVSPRAPHFLELCNGRLALDSVAMDLPTLGRRLRQQYASAPLGPVFVHACRGVRYQQVISAMDTARGAGARVFAFTPRGRP